MIEDPEISLKSLLRQEQPVYHKINCKILMRKSWMIIIHYIFFL